MKFLTTFTIFVLSSALLFSGETGKEIIKAAESGDYALVRLLVESGVNPDKTDKPGGRTALMYACSANNHEAAAYLISKGAGVNYSSSDGRTPLTAWVEGNPENFTIGEMLLKEGADINAKAVDGTTPFTSAFMKALGTNDTKLLEFLIENGADINEQLFTSSDIGLSALHLSAESDNDDLARMLIKNGADIEIKNSDGETPLVLAAKSESASAVSLLIKSGADIDAKDRNGTKVIDILASSDNPDMKEFLDQNTNK